MECRAPLSIINSSNIRRRSGGHQKTNTTASDDEHGLEHEQDGDIEHTVFLVEPREQSTPFNTIPLTPQSEPLSRLPSNSSSRSTETRASQIPRLPTPDFGKKLGRQTTRSSRVLDSSGKAQEQGRTYHVPLQSYLHRGLSFVSFHVPSATFFSSSPAPSHPQSIRGGSESIYSARTATSRMVESIETTDRFTRKWPRPKSLRYIEDPNGPLNKVPDVYLDQMIILALEEGQGIGMDPMQSWTTFKWCLLFSVSLVFIYGTAGFAYAIMTWFRTWDKADVMYAADNDILILIILAGSITTFTALVGISGVFLNSRPILATYTLLLWPALMSMLAIGYISYKRATFSLDHKLNLSWSQYYTPFTRLLIQDSLHCCGFYNALHEATPSKRCYPRTPLPGCKGELYRFESDNLRFVWSAVFALVPLHLLNIIAALLCANHLTRTFGKGITPKRYRLNSADVRADADKILRGMNQTGVQAVTRPDSTRASSNDGFREDREERHVLLHHHLAT